MTTPSSPAPSASTPCKLFCLRVVRTLALGICALVVVCMLAVAGSAVWLRTDSGIQKLTEVLNAALDPMVQFDAVRMEFPWAVQAANLTVHDVSGAWLHIGTASVRVDWTALFKNELRVVDITATDMVLERLPEPSAEPSPAPQPADLPDWRNAVHDWPVWLPILRVESLRANAITAAPSVWEALGLLPPPAATTPLPIVHLEADALQLMVEPSGEPALTGAVRLLATDLSQVLPLEKATLRVQTSGVLAALQTRLEVTAESLRLHTMHDDLAETAAKSSALMQVDLACDLATMSATIAGHVEMRGLPPTVFVSDTAKVRFSGHAAATNNGVVVRDLSLHSPVLAVQASGSWLASLPFPGVQGTVELTMPDVALQRLLPSVSFPAEMMPHAGQATATVTLTPQISAVNSRMEAMTQVRLSNLQWGADTQPLSQLVGAGAQLDTRFFMQHKPAEASAHYLFEQLACSLQTASVESSLQGSLTLTSSGVADVDATATARLKHLSALVQDGRGAIDAVLKARGAVQMTDDAPLTGEPLRVALEVTAPELAALGHHVQQVSLRAEASKIKATAPFSLHGSLQAAAGSDMGALRVEANAALVDTPTTRSVHINTLHGLFAGVTVQGTLAAALPLNTLPAASAGKLDGQLTVKVTDWKALSALAGPVHASEATARVHMKTVSGKASLDASLALHNLATRPGGARLSHMQADANITDVFGDISGHMRATLGRGMVSPQVRWKHGTLEGFLRHGTGRLTAELAGALSVSLAAAYEQNTLTVEQLRAGLADVGIRLMQPATVQQTSTGELRVQHVQMQVEPSGLVQMDARVGTQVLQMNGHVQAVPLAVIQPFADMPLPQGHVNAHIAVSGRMDKPTGSLTVQVNDVRYADSVFMDSTGVSSAAWGADALPEKTEINPHNVQPVVQAQGMASPLQVALEITLAAGRSDAEAVVQIDGMGAQPLLGQCTIPLTYVSGNFPGLDMRRRLRGAVSWNGRLESLWRFMPIADLRASGGINLEATLSGTLQEPRPTARLTLHEGTLTDVALGVGLFDVHTTVSIQPSGLLDVTFASTDGHAGKLTLAGKLNVFDLAQPVSGVLALRDFAPLHRNDVRIQLSGDIQTTGSVLAPVVQGRLTVNGGEVRIDELSGSSVTTLDVINAELPVVHKKEPVSASDTSVEQGAVGRIAVHIDAPNRLYVRGMGLESEWQGSLSLVGALSSPSISGEVRSIRGDLRLFGRTFVLTRGIVAFPGGWPPQPLLDVALTYIGEQVAAVVAVSGSAMRPKLKLSSQPPLPQDEILAQILFGQSASALSQGELLQLAAAVASLKTGSNVQGVLDTAKNLLGLDVLRFGNSSKRTAASSAPNPFAGPNFDGAGEDGSANTTLELGKYVMDNVYVGVEQGMNADSTGAVVEIDLGSHFDVKAKSSGEASEVGLNWLWNY